MKINPSSLNLSLSSYFGIVTGKNTKAHVNLRQLHHQKYVPSWVPARESWSPGVPLTAYRQLDRLQMSLLGSLGALMGLMSA